MPRRQNLGPQLHSGIKRGRGATQKAWRRAGEEEGEGSGSGAQPVMLTDHLSPPHNSTRHYHTTFSEVFHAREGMKKRGGGGGLSLGLSCLPAVPQ